MKRNLKALGLAMMAAFAFSAFAASTASAQTLGQITSANGEDFTLTGEETGATFDNSLTAFGGTIHCPGTTYTGHTVGATPHQFLESGATEITVTPDYGENCLNDEEDPITIDMRDCDYRFYDGTTTPVGNEEGTYGITFAVDCAESNGILRTGGLCTVRVPPQEGLTGLHATNQPEGHIKVSGTIHNTTMTACGFLHTGEAAQHLSVTVGGHNELEEPTAVEISD